MMEKPLAVSNADAQRIKRRGGAGRHPGVRQLRDHVVSEPRRDLDADEGAEGRRRDPQDGRDGRPPGSESDQRAAGVLRVALGSGEERRRRAVRFRLLRRQPDDVADGQPAAARRDRGRRSTFKPAVYPRVDDEATILRRVSERAGHHPGVVELAVRTGRISKCTANAATRSRPAATACASRCRTSPSTPSRRSRARPTSAIRSRT